MRMLTVAATLANFALACTASAATTSHKNYFEYISPRPGAELLPKGCTLIVRPHDAYAAVDWSASIIVKGGSSGQHSGDWVVADDLETWIFKPHRDFEPGESVTVTMSIGQTYSYTFAVSAKSHDSYERDSSELEALGVGAVRRERFDVPALREQKAASLVAHQEPPRGVLQRDALERSLQGHTPFTLPYDLPVVTVTTDESPSEGSIFVSPITFSRGPAIASYLMILDNSGFPLFFRKLVTRAFDFKRQDNGLLTYFHGNKFWVMDSTYTDIDSVQAGNGFATDLHEFVILPNDHMLLMIYDQQVVDMSQIVAGGDTATAVIGLVIQELDASKNVVFQWRSWDHFDILDTEVDVTSDRIDYAHGNAIEPDHDGHLLISSRHMNEITKIDRQTGDIIWRLGGKKNQFALVGDTQWFTYQHDIRRLSNGNITLFDNGNMGSPQVSRAVEYAIDEIAMTATLVWQYRDPASNYGSAMGNAQRLPDGSTLIGWGATNPNVTEVGRNGEKRYEMTFDPDVFTYRAFRFPWSGTAAAPTLWADTGATGLVTLHFTKFGDGNVAKYYVYQDDNPGPTTRIGSTLGNSFVVSDSLTSGRISHFRVTAVDDQTNESSYSNEIAVATKALITAFDAQHTGGHISLTWTTMVSVEPEGFNVYRSEQGGKYAAINHERLASDARAYDDEDVAPGRAYSYLLGVVDQDREFLSPAATAAVPAGPFTLHQNHPNPFNPNTTISFHLPRQGHVTLIIYDTAGRRVRSLVNAVRDSGDNTAEWDGVDDDGHHVSSGVYFYQLSTQENASARKLMLLR